MDTINKRELESPPSLLVVDDDPDILRVVRFYLSKKNYEVYTASSGVEALEVLEKVGSVELILSDVMMPRMNGLELLAAVKSNEAYSDIPLILISAEGETSKKVTGLSQGAHDFITKPFNFDELMARVENHIQLRRLRKEVLLANKALTQQNDKLNEDLEAARGVQMALMPEKLPTHEAYTLGSSYKPADTLGGDFYDVVDLNKGSKVGLLIADVCGHGVSAALVTAMAKISFKNACVTQKDPAAVLKAMNHELNGSMRDGFVTLFYGVYDIETGVFSYSSGGHPPLLLQRRQGNKIEMLNGKSTFIGIFEQVEFHTDTVQLEKGDRIFFYTDGLYESQNEKEEPYGMEKVVEFLKENPDMKAQPLVDRCLDNLMKFVNGRPFDDDITLLTFYVSN